MDNNCPKCGVDLRDMEHLDANGRQKYWRTIGRYDERADRVTAYRCPDCNHIWPRDLKESTDGN